MRDEILLTYLTERELILLHTARNSNDMVEFNHWIKVAKSRAKMNVKIAR